MADPLSRIEEDIDGHILAGTTAFNSDFREKDGGVYVIKYLPAKRLGSFLGSGKRLFASDVPGFTWGDGVYIAPLSAPLTTMMFGRIGVVGRIEPRRVYDATRPPGRDLYQAWIRFQWQWYNLLTTTIHSNVANRYLRNAFRTKFRIDCVIFRPDQFCPGYVGPNSDSWFTVTHWTNGRVAAGLTSSVLDAEWCVVGCEEFSGDQSNLVFDAMIGPAFRGARLSRAQLRAVSPGLSNAILDRYRRKRANPAERVLVVAF